MESLKRIVENSDTKAGCVFDFAIQALIVLSLVTFPIETLPNLPDHTRHWLRLIEIATVSVFTIEYILRVLVADRKLGFVFSFFGIIDLLSILPFYVGFADLLIHAAIVANSWYSDSFSRMVFV